MVELICADAMKPTWTAVSDACLGVQRSAHTFPSPIIRGRIRTCACTELKTYPTGGTAGTPVGPRRVSTMYCGYNMISTVVTKTIFINLSKFYLESMILLAV